ncbi:MAG: hypothetical protein JSR48_01160 [Verrucomicrobia bacterium]|nr:hypothetical protein [Verrucomicrobiota bacterium]
MAPIPAPPDDPGEFIPSEVRIWLSRGWKIVPSQRRGIVIEGPKKMRGLGRLSLVLGGLMQAAYFTGAWVLGLIGLGLILGAWLDFRFNTRPPTMFFAEPGEKKRVLDRS